MSHALTLDQALEPLRRGPAARRGPARRRRNARADRAPRRGRPRARADAGAADPRLARLRRRGVRQRPARDDGTADRLDRLDLLRRQPRRRAAARRAHRARDRARVRPRRRAGARVRRGGVGRRARCRACACARRTRRTSPPSTGAARPTRRAAEQAVRAVAEAAEAEGLHPHWGRKVLEVRPAVEVDKGGGIAWLLADADVDHAVYVGDDTTDLDAFRGLRGLRRPRAGWRSAVCVGVRSDETPPELTARGRPAGRRARRRPERPRGAALKFTDFLKATVFISAGAATALGAVTVAGAANRLGVAAGAGDRRLVDPRRPLRPVAGAQARDLAADRAAAGPGQGGDDPARAPPGPDPPQPAVAAAGVVAGRGRAGVPGARRWPASPAASRSSGRWPGAIRRRR